MLIWQAYKSKVRSLVFSPDGSRIATLAARSRIISLWNPSTGELVSQMFAPSGFHVDGAAFFPDGLHIAGNIENEGARVWHIPSGNIIATFANPSNRSDAIAVSPDGNRLMLAEFTGIAQWNDPTHRRPPDKNFRGRAADKKYRIDHNYPVRIGFSPGGKYFCIAEWYMHLFDPNSLKAVRQFRDPVPRGGTGSLGATVVAFAFKPDDSRLAVALGRRAVVWSPADLEANPVPIAGHGRTVKAVGFLPDGNLLTAGMDGTVRVWHPDTGVELRSFDWGVGKVQCAAVSPDGTLCAAGSDDGRIVVWDVDS
ncbi:MAG: WD40 repeat domain-containing protein [Planctomycetes bacterium]|nr:WD40 repeat domain-containing protein [Planctomycetota bacterium]